MEVELTETEKLVTKMNIQLAAGVLLRSRQLAETRRNRVMILRHNITHYGLHEQELRLVQLQPARHHLEDGDLLADPLSHTWKRIKFRTFLNQAEFGDLRLHHLQRLRARLSRGR